MDHPNIVRLFAVYEAQSVCRAGGVKKKHGFWGVQNHDFMVFLWFLELFHEFPLVSSFLFSVFFGRFSVWCQVDQLLQVDQSANFYERLLADEDFF